jgi:hypothetical protein
MAFKSLPIIVIVERIRQVSHLKVVVLQVELKARSWY